MIWRGEIYDIDLGQPIGHEPAFRRPAVVVSANVLSNGPGGLVAVVPVSSRAYGLRSHVELGTGSSGLGHVSYARCDQLRFISTRRIETRCGMASPEEMQVVDQALRFVLEL